MLFLDNFPRWFRQRVTRRQHSQAEPAAAMQQALMELRRISAAGVAVPDLLVKAIFTANKEIRECGGTLSPDTGTSFYDAYRQLTVLAARLDDPYLRASVNSEYLLKFASE